MPPKKRYVIGIDPDNKNFGFAVWDRKHRIFSKLTVLPVAQVIEYIATNYFKSETIIRVDAGWLNNKSNYHTAQGARVREKMAYNTGMNAGYGKAFCEVMKYYGYEVIEVKPTSSKTSMETFNAMTQNKYKDNFHKLLTFKQEIVDSGILCYQF